MGAFSFSYICVMPQSYGASVQTVYNTLQDLTNKDQQGFITELEFNRFAPIAQLNIYNRFFDELKDSNRMSRAGFNPVRDKQRTKRILEDLSYFSKKQNITKNTTLLAFEKPTDLSRIISMNTFGDVMLDQSTKSPIELCYDEEKIDRILANNLSAPSEEFPVALISDHLHVFPTSIKRIELRYYKYPGSRGVDGARNANSLPPIYDTSANTYRDFELPQHYTSDLVYEIGKMAGLNLRDADVIKATGEEMTFRQQAETF